MHHELRAGCSFPSVFGVDTSINSKILQCFLNFQVIARKTAHWQKVQNTLYICKFHLSERLHISRETTPEFGVLGGLD